MCWGAYALLFCILLLASAQLTPQVLRAYNGYRVTGMDSTDFLLPPGFEIGSERVLCASVANSTIICVKDDAEVVSIPGLLYGTVYLDVVIYRRDVGQDGVVDMSQLVPTRRRHFRYYISSVVKFPFHRSLTAEVQRPAFGVISTDVVRFVLADRDALTPNYLVTIEGLEAFTDVITTRVIEPNDGAGLEAGSWFLWATPRATAYSAPDGQGEASGHVFGYPVQGYVEVVLDPDTIRAFRKFRRPAGESESGFPAEIGERRYEPAPTFATVSPGGAVAAVGAAAGTAAAPRRRMICIWSSQVMDGQRNVWLKQTQHLDARRFSFTWLLDVMSGGGENRGGGALLDALQALGGTSASGGPSITVRDSPALVISHADLDDAPGDGQPAAADVWGGEITNLYVYAHSRFLAAGGRIEDISPAWCKLFYVKISTAMREAACDVTVFGNHRAYSSNAQVIDASAALGIPSVAELANLNVPAHSVADMLVAPSLFAAEQRGVQSAVRRALEASQPALRVEVISPSVDTDLFNPDRVPPASAYLHPACVDIGVHDADSSRDRCFVVGFVARLSPEKNPGLFLQMAHELLRLHPFARFAVVGDGVLRASLEDLAARLQISWAVHFTGWVGGDDLPCVLAGMDVIVNPGLVLETFCIANIEAMSMQAPLVTFAVGGVGEYVAEPNMRSKSGRRGAVAQGGEAFSVSENAVVVHRASPEALAAAVHHLALHPELRRALGAAGRRTVVQSFSVARQMEQYAALYDSLFP